MAAIGAGYDLSATTYSPDGRIFQVEYAQKAVESSGTVVGIRCKDGVVLGVEKLIHSRLLKAKVNRRIATVDLHAGMVGSGLVADCRQLANRAREECSNHRETFDQPISPGQLAERVAMFMQAYTLFSSVRPFGANMLLGAVDPLTHTPHLYLLEPSGVYWGYRAAAIGRGRVIAKTELEKLPHDQLDLTMSVKEVARIIYLAHEEAGKDKEFELELSWIGPQSNYQHELIPEALLQEAIQHAQTALESRF